MALSPGSPLDCATGSDRTPLVHRRGFSCYVPSRCQATCRRVAWRRARRKQCLQASRSSRLASETADVQQSSSQTSLGAPSENSKHSDGDRPLPRFPTWIVGSDRNGITVPELQGASAAEEAERLVAASTPFVWRQAGFCPLPDALTKQGNLSQQALDTNVSARCDKKFVYVSPTRLESGPYDSEAIMRDFMPMRLNETWKLGDIRKRFGELPKDGERPCLTSESDDKDEPGASTCGWARARLGDPGKEMPYAFQVLLEALTPEEGRKVPVINGRVPAEIQSWTARLNGLPGTPWAVWRPDLKPLAAPVAAETAWDRIGALARAGGWGAFSTSGFMVSGRDALTPLHYDKHHNIFVQLRGAKRFLLLGAEQTPRLYGFPTLHALDPLSRVDLELPEDTLQARWPLVKGARGVAVTLEAGDVLVLPQGVWHHVHSLEEENMSVNFLFGLGNGEGCGEDGYNVRVAALPEHRRLAALSELAKTAEHFLSSSIGVCKALDVFRVMYGAACGVAAASARLDVNAESPGARKLARAAEKFSKFLAERLSDGSGGAPVLEPREFVKRYYHPQRFKGLARKTQLAED